MTCNLQKDSADVRMALHNRLIRRLNNAKACQGDEVPIEYCDGQYHWRSFGWGPDVRKDRWLYETIFEKCPDFEKQVQEEFIGRHGDMECSFSNFIVADENRDAYTKIKGWRKVGFQTLIIHGATGRGKTHLAKAVQLEFLKDYENTAFITAEALHEVFIKAQPSAHEYDLEAMQQLAEIREAGLFILDDLGSERQTASGFFAEKFKQLLDEKSGRMIITTNFTPQELEERYDSKIMSRILEKAIAIPLRGKDHRRVA